MQDENTNKSIQFTVIPIVMSFSTMYRDYMKVFNESVELNCLKLHKGLCRVTAKSPSYD